MRSLRALPYLIALEIIGAVGGWIIAPNNAARLMYFIAVVAYAAATLVMAWDIAARGSSWAWALVLGGVPGPGMLIWLWWRGRHPLPGEESRKTSRTEEAISR